MLLVARGGRSTQWLASTETQRMQLAPPETTSPPRLTDAAAMAGLTGWMLTACGGGDDGTARLPAGFQTASDDTPRRHVLGAATAGPAAAAAAAPVPTATALMDWAERAYSTFFPGPQSNLVAAPFTYRHYPATGNYLGVANGRVYVLGPVTGGGPDIADVGALADFAVRVHALTAAADDAMAARFLGQATLGVTDADMAAVRTLGYAAWLQAEMAKPPSSGNWQFLLDRGFADDLANKTTSAGADPAIWQRLIAAPDSLRQRVTLALSEIFVVGFDGLSGPWKQFKLAAWWDLLATHAFGNYRSLLEAVTLNAAMGQYLSTAGNQKEDARTGRLPDENYAREVMQLFSIGLVMLNPDGTPQMDAQGQPIESYTQDTVSQLARVFTGWGLDSSPFETGPEVMARPMVLTATRHSTLAVDALGLHIPANTDGAAALRMALDTLAAHPNVGPFIGRQLIQRLVTSNPSPAYVARVAATFADNGHGVRGDLSAVVRAVLIDDEARDPGRSSDPTFGKLREPLLRFLHWTRSFGLRSTSGNWTVGNLSSSANRLGQSPLRAPSVFNWFRPGFLPPGTALANALLVAPEFQIADETSVAGYLNFMQSAIPAKRFDLQTDYAAELALADNPAALVDRVQLLLCASSLQADSRDTIVNAVTSVAATTPAGRANRVHATILLVMASPEFLVQT
jgi:uncharacterized protein (DUF1800 family)